MAVKMAGVASKANFFKPAYDVNFVEDSVRYGKIATTFSDIGNHVDFRIPASQHYIDFRRTRLYLSVQILRMDGVPVDVTDYVGLVNSPGTSIFASGQIFLNGNPINSSASTYNYKAMIETLLGASTSVKEGRMDSKMLWRDSISTKNKQNPKVADQRGVMHRREYTKEGDIVEISTLLHMDFCMQSTYLLPGVDVGITLTRADDMFSLIGQKSYKLKIHDAYLKVCHVELSQICTAMICKTLNTKPFVYSYQDTNMVTETISGGSFQKTIDRPFTVVPSKLFVMMVDSKSYKGDPTTNPFCFKDFDLASAAFYVDGVSVPSEPLEVDVKNKKYLEAYDALFDTLDLPDDVDIDIRRSDFLDGNFILGMNVDPTAVPAKGYWNKKKKALTRLELKFHSPLDDNVTVILYGVFPCEVTIDNERRVSFKQ